MNPKTPKTHYRGTVPGATERKLQADGRFEVYCGTRVHADRITQDWDKVTCEICLRFHKNQE